MNQILRIISKIENPLNFLKKDSFKNINVVRDLEKTLGLFFHELKDHLRQNRASLENEEALLSIIAELEEQASHFDKICLKERKERVDGMIGGISKIKNELTGEGLRPPVSVVEPGETEVLFAKLDLPVQFIKGVGPKLSEILHKKNIRTVEDLLFFLPRKYEDRRNIRKISDIELGEKETFVAIVSSAELRYYGRRKIFEVSFSDNTDVITAKWFQGNMAYLKNLFKVGERFVLTGEVRGSIFFKEIIHPDYERLYEDEGDISEFERIVPVYSEMEGLRQKHLRRIMKEAVLNYASAVISPIPSDISMRNNLMDISDAIKRVHLPENNSDIKLLNEHVSEAHRRLIFDEFFFFEVGMAARKQGYVKDNGISFKTDGHLTREFIGQLPFEMTSAQKRVSKEILADMKNQYPMNRLLQGDVGSGKTVVSMVPIVTACENGYQSAFMAPTEILAAQHYESVRSWSSNLGLKTVILRGGMTKKERLKCIQEIEKGDANIIVGTHSLVQEGVSFNKLGFVVIDEQHRFGVMQRAVLREKGLNPDVLVMTATPIPRTLSLTVYGDLDVSVIDEMPPGKKEVKTKLFYESQRRRVYEIIKGEVVKGNQVFIVYPLVEESESLDLKDATSMARHLDNDVFKDLKVGLLHGRMKAAEKKAIMEGFRNRDIDVLVSTTVIEVGIDIPTASLMVVEHAERFGLSQLHQLRGRVGRSDITSYCILLAHHLGSDDARRRLKVMEKTCDGFRIAEEDLAIRGPGEFLGTRQSGLPDFRIASIIRDAKILNEARREAMSLVEKDPDLKEKENRLLKEVLLRKWQDKLVIAKTG